MKAETDKPILIVLNKNKPNELHLSLDQRVINFNLHPIQSLDYSQPFQIPQQIATTATPFQLLSTFAEAHNYNPKSPRIKLPLHSPNYRQIVDPITYELCERYTNLDYAGEVDQILRLAKWLQFGELERAVAAAVGVNFWVGSQEKDVEAFMSGNGVDRITPEQIEQIYEEHKDLFNYVEQRTKEQFIKQSQTSPEKKQQ